MLPTIRRQTLDSVAAGEGAFRPAEAGRRFHPLLHVFGANQLFRRHGLPQKIPIRRSGDATIATSPAASEVRTAWRRFSGS